MRIIEEIVLYIVICNVIFINKSFWNEVKEIFCYLEKSSEIKVQYPVDFIPEELRIANCRAAVKEKNPLDHPG